MIKAASFAIQNAAAHSRTCPTKFSHIGAKYVIDGRCSPQIEIKRLEQEEDWHERRIESFVGKR